MNKVAHYLQEHLTGEVLVDDDVRRYFATDGSIFSLTPAIVVYPRNENDIRKTTRFSWQLAERGKLIPITARGLGTDQAGGALGSGVMVVFPAHMNRILELDSKKGNVTVEPGINYGKLQQALHTHGFFLPPFPSSYEFSTIGGAVANNASGEKTIKYGSTRQYVKGLRVVLANGEVIETKRLSKKELSKKMGLSNFEGEIYRGLDALIDDNYDLTQDTKLAVSKNSAGYDLGDIKRRDGSFDLTPLIVGSQGTLGIVTEVMLETETYNPNATLIVAYINDLTHVENIIIELNNMSHSPSAIEFVDDNLLNFIHAKNPNQLKGIIQEPFPKIVMLIEFDDLSERVQKKMTKKTLKLLSQFDIAYQVETNDIERERLWKIRHSVATLMSHSEGTSKALPIIEDGIVPVERIKSYIEGVYGILNKHHLNVAIWGHAGNANLHMQPFLDLSQVGDRQKVFKVMDEYYNMVIEMGGSTSGEHNDGRLRGAYLPRLYGESIYQLFVKVKNIFDPYNILNPGVKVNVTLDDIKPLLRSEYSMKNTYDHMPRT